MLKHKISIISFSLHRYVTHWNKILYIGLTLHVMGRNRSVGIATRYGLDGPGIESRLEGGIFRTSPDRLWGQPSLIYDEYRVFDGGKAAGAWR